MILKAIVFEEIVRYVCVCSELTNLTYTNRRMWNLIESDLESYIYIQLIPCAHR